MNAPFYPTRERLLDAANHAETVAETLIPWANLRADTLAERDAMDARFAANQAAYFERIG